MIFNVYNTNGGEVRLALPDTPYDKQCQGDVPLSLTRIGSIEAVVKPPKVKKWQWLYEKNIGPPREFAITRFFYPDKAVTRLQLGDNFKENGILKPIPESMIEE